MKTDALIKNQNAADTAQKHAIQPAGFVDRRPSAAAQRKLAEMAAGSDRSIPLGATGGGIAQRSENLEEEEATKQAKSIDAHDSSGTVPAMGGGAGRANDTGLPDKLKAGVESMSGMSMDHVKVHYNSDKPAQLNAHAYAQGSDIHIASGQERHLPHEAWHVVQQAQGRVKPTMQAKGAAINDDHALEHEADIMGMQALQTKTIDKGEKKHAARTSIHCNAFGDMRLSNIAQYKLIGMAHASIRTRQAKFAEQKTQTTPVQRVLVIGSSPNTPHHNLKYQQFQALNKKKRNLGLTVPAWLWLKKLAASKKIVSFSTWREAIDAYNDYKKLTSQLQQPQPIKGPEFRYGESPVEPLSMNDAHGIVGIANWIENMHPIASSTYVSPGGSADFFGTAMRMHGGQVVDIPLSGIKDDKVGGKQRQRAITFISRCFGATQPKKNVVIFDAISTGSALLILKDLIAEALHLDEANIYLVGLNNPPGADGKKVVSEKKVSIVDQKDKPHVAYVKSRLQNQSYKTFGRKYPKNQVGDLNDLTADRRVKEVGGMNGKLMATLFAMHEVASSPFVEAPDEEGSETDSEEISREGETEEN